ncbi:hypothetical protein [Phenylobacterium sp.]|uniref:hypothetical protein n=1 Tax=Phenylobacterium sp. TaxID=1871053 RepID=UPI002812689C|nr:hypothetical protein [Phenylobacterium sp.]
MTAFRELGYAWRMKSWIALCILALAAPGAARAADDAPTVAELSEALDQVRGKTQAVRNVRCAKSTPGFVRCTYHQPTPKGYTRWAVLVSEQEGKWSVSEGPVRERAESVRRNKR